MGVVSRERRKDPFLFLITHRSTSWVFPFLSRPTPRLADADRRDDAELRGTLLPDGDDNRPRQPPMRSQTIQIDDCTKTASRMRNHGSWLRKFLHFMKHGPASFPHPCCHLAGWLFAALLQPVLARLADGGFDAGGGGGCDRPGVGDGGGAPQGRKDPANQSKCVFLSVFERFLLASWVFSESGGGRCGRAAPAVQVWSETLGQHQLLLLPPADCCPSWTTQRSRRRGLPAGVDRAGHGGGRELAAAVLLQLPRCRCALPRGHLKSTQQFVFCGCMSWYVDLEFSVTQKTAGSRRSTRTTRSSAKRCSGPAGSAATE